MVPFKNITHAVPCHKIQPKHPGRHEKSAKVSISGNYVWNISSEQGKGSKGKQNELFHLFCSMIFLPFSTCVPRLLDSCPVSVSTL